MWVISFEPGEPGTAIPIVLHQDFVKAIDDFHEKYCIGKGGFGRVYKAELLSDLIATLPVRFVDLQRGSTPIPLFFGTLFDDLHILTCIFLGRGLSFGSAREEEGGAVGGGYGSGDGDWERDNGVGGGEFGIFWF
ncbi:unnamed protein product [Prunus armeniaca]